MTQLQSMSTALWDRAQRVMAGGPATLSKHPARFCYGVSPMFLRHGHGAYVADVDGNIYLDCIGALGAVLLGHAHPLVTVAVQSQASRLALSSLSTALEVEVAELLSHHVPNAEMVRFATNGKDVTEAAIKVARYVTGKQHVCYVGYHGGFPDYLITTDRHGGILPQIQQYNHQIPWDSIRALVEAVPRSEDLAAIMVEVPPAPWQESPAVVREVLLNYQRLAHANKALFILDDIVTWGRYGVSGAQGYYNVDADLVCLSKALGNGYPIAALAGKRDYMRAFDNGRVFLSTTYGASPMGLAACQATIEALSAEYPALVAHGHGFGAALVDALDAWHVPASVRGKHGRLIVDWQSTEVASAAALKTLWLQELHSHGVLAGAAWLPMTCWTEAIVQTLLSAVAQALMTIDQVLAGKRALTDALRCPVITDVFEVRA